MIFFFSFLFVGPSMLWAGSGSEGIHLDGKNLELIWGVPFSGMLLSIAIFPIFLPKFWHNHYGKVALFWWSSLFFPLILFEGLEVTLFYLLEVYLGEYLPFVVLLFSLYTISGGIQLKGKVKGTTLVNVIMMVIGIVLASCMGTTGAAMLMIRPLIKANHYRKYKVHTIIFFIILVANVGGSLSPLGDPPLFLGFLKGVPFLWPLKNMFLPMIFLVVSLLFIYVIVDMILIRVGSGYPRIVISRPLSICGKRNFILLLGVIGAVIISGIFRSDVNNVDHWFLSYHGTVILTQGIMLQLVLLMILSWISLKITPKAIRVENQFYWEPMLEVTKLFFAIFFTIIPVIAILKAGTLGDLSFLINVMMDSQQQPMENSFFWVTALLSGFLDNAPTYLVFFNLLGGEASVIVNVYHKALLAISMGAVFAGALTYIGNAPNFMIRSIAEKANIKMPSFFIYIFWSALLLFPLFFIIDWLFL